MITNIAIVYVSIHHVIFSVCGILPPNNVQKILIITTSPMTPIVLNVFVLTVVKISFTSFDSRRITYIVHNINVISIPIILLDRASRLFRASISGIIHIIMNHIFANII